MAQVNVEAEIDSVGILIGEQARMTIGVTAPEGAKIEFPNLKERQLITPGVEVVSVGQEQSKKVDGGAVKTSKTFTLTSFDEKLYAIPAQKVKVNGKPYNTKTLALKVVTIDVDTLHPEQFFPAKDVQNNPFKWQEWSLPFWLSVIALLLCAAWYYLYRRLKENKPIVTRIRIVKRLPAHQKAMNEINQLKAEKMASSEDQKTYYTRLTDTLRRYIEERFGFNAMEMTSTEIIYNLQKSGDKTMIDELKELFETADLVKFAKYSTLINENDLNLVNAVNFIDQTKIEGQPTEERIVPKLSDDDKRAQKSRKLIKVLLWTTAIAAAVLLALVVWRLWELTM